MSVSLVPAQLNVNEYNVTGLRSLIVTEPIFGDLGENITVYVLLSPSMVAFTKHSHDGAGQSVTLVHNLKMSRIEKSKKNRE